MAKLRIKSLCKEKGIALKDMAAKLGMDASTFSQFINSPNPSIPTLERIADYLSVGLPELFEQPTTNNIYGVLYVNNEPHIVKNRAEIEALLKETSE